MEVYLAMFNPSSLKTETVVFVLLCLIIAFFCYRCVALDLEDEARENERLRSLAKPDLAGLTVEEARSRLTAIGWDVDAIVGHGSVGIVIVDTGLTSSRGVTSREVSHVDYNVIQVSETNQTIRQKERLGSCVINYAFVSDDVLEDEYADRYDYWMVEYDYFKEWLASGEERPALKKSVKEWRDEIANYDADDIPLSRKRDHQEIVQLATDFASSVGA